MTSPSRHRLVGLVGAALLAPASLAACSSSKPSAAHTSNPASTSTSAPSASSVPPTGPGTSSTTPGGGHTSTTKVPPGTTATTSAGPTPGGRCAVSQLQAARGPGGGAAAGHIVANIVLRNSSATPCTLDGYPGLQMLDAHGHSLPTVVERGAAMGLAAVPPALVTLAPGASASFSLAYEDVPVGGEGVCPTSAQLEVTPPNAYSHLVLSISLTPCRGGTITVSPVVAGTNGVQGR